MTSALIDPQAARLKADFGLFPVVASEIEFYLHGAKAALIAAFWGQVEARCHEQHIALFKCEEERGKGQYEIALRHHADLSKVARDTVALREIVTQAAKAHGMQADFSARPFEHEPGNGLHIHVHLDDASGKNTFYKRDDDISHALKYSIGGLLAWLPDCMPVFAPHEESYARFAEKSNAPLTVSWGANNRTVAVRLPDKAHDDKHIEHRVSGADADPEKVIAVILAAMHDGLTRRIEPGPQMYGDAALLMYDLPKFSHPLAECIERMQRSETVGGYFDVSALISR